MKRLMKRAEYRYMAMMILLLAVTGLALLPTAAGSIGQSIIVGVAAISHPLLNDPQLKSFNVSGKVNTNSGASTPGVTITFSRVSGTGTLPPPAQTDKTGSWSQKGFEPGTAYRATPSATGFSFTPGSLDFKDTRADLNFQSVPVIFSASGNVGSVIGPAPSSGSSSGQKPPRTGIGGVQITFSLVSGAGLLPSSALTDSNGNWTQSGFQAGSTYRATPSKSGFNFNPSFIDISRSTSVSFDGASNGFSAVGKVATADGRGVPDVHIRFSRVSGTGGVPGEVVTDQKGQWGQKQFERGTVYKITPVRLTEDAFSPRSIDNVSNGASSLPEVGNLNFVITIPKFSAFGRVDLRDNAEGVADVEIKFSRADGAPAPASVKTNARGEWGQSGFEAGATYTLTPSKPAFDDAFRPARLEFRGISSSPYTNLQIIVTSKFFTAQGKLLRDGAPVANAIITFREILPTRKRVDGCVKTSADGIWVRANLERGKVYEISPFDEFHTPVKVSGPIIDQIIFRDNSTPGVTVVQTTIIGSPPNPCAVQP